jgi:hypothetical protein
MIEHVTNEAKHDAGKIRKGNPKLVVCDEGKGLSDDFDWSKSLGMKIVNDMARSHFLRVPIPADFAVTLLTNKPLLVRPTLVCRAFGGASVPMLAERMSIVAGHARHDESGMITRSRPLSARVQ